MKRVEEVDLFRDWFSIGRKTFLGSFFFYYSGMESNELANLAKLVEEQFNLLSDSYCKSLCCSILTASEAFLMDFRKLLNCLV